MQYATVNQYPNVCWSALSNFNLLIITDGGKVQNWPMDNYLVDFIKNKMYIFAGGLVDPLSSYSFSIIKAMSVMCVSSGELGKINAVLSALESLFPLVAVQGYTSIWRVISKVSWFSIRIPKIILFLKGFDKNVGESKAI